MIDFSQYDSEFIDLLSVFIQPELYWIEFYAFILTLLEYLFDLLHFLFLKIKKSH